MKRLTLFIATLFTSLQLMAIPAKPVKQTLTLRDGSIVTATLRGDEHFHFYSTDDGRVITLQDDGTLDYTSREEISREWSERRNLKFAQRVELSRARRSKTGKPHREFGVPGKVVGNKKGLVILVNFQGTQMKHTRQQYDDQFNQEGYSSNKHIGSVRDYFLKQSYGQLTIDFDVVGPYTLSKELSFYGRNASFSYNYSTGTYTFKNWVNTWGKGDDVNAFGMVYEACNAADPEVDFKDYDWDGDGEVDQVYIIYAGYGEAQGGAANTIWPHEYELDMAAYFGNITGYPSFSTYANLWLDDVKINTYACSSELANSSGSQMDGIGSACHEFTHCLGLPDMYDRQYENFGMGNWDLMDQGSYNGPTGYAGSVPAAYTAYERWFSGWLTPIELDEGDDIDGMPAITDEPVSYIVYNQNNRNEYFLLQNIQKKSWNNYAGGHGLLIQHVFYDKNVWQSNEVNCTSYYNTSGNQYERCTIVPADNSRDESTLSGDPFPGTTKNTQFTDTSTPGAILYATGSGGNTLKRPIENITEAGGLISFTFNGGAPLSAPIALTVADEDKGTEWFRASWNEVENAVSYNVEVTEYIEPEEEETDPDAPEQPTLLLSEDFSLLANYKGAFTIDSKLDQYLHTTGWTGSKTYSGTDNSGVNGIKLGTSSLPGSLTTPLLDAPTEGIATILVSIAPYGSDPLSFQVDVITVDDTGETSITTRSYTSAGTYLIVARDINTSFKVKMQTTANRAYIRALHIADGQYGISAFDNIVPGSSQTEQTTVSSFTVEAPTTELRLSDLAQTRYSYRVQAVNAKGKTSAWSNVVDVLLPTTPTAIHCIPSLTSDSTVAVYTLSGQSIKSTASPTDWADNLPHGIYILRSGLHTYKVVK